jgi:polysaccharide biosynthesis/export protein
MRKNVFLFLILTVALIQTALAQENVPASQVKGYLLGPGDQISVKVLGEKDFDFETLVDENGNIEIPFFDKPLPAMCRTERDLKMDVVKFLAKYLKNPQISLRVTERNTSDDTVMIYGAVLKQQEVILGRQFRLSELIAASGGETEDAGGTVQLFRTRPPMCGDPDVIKEWNSQLSDTNQIPSKLYSLNSIRNGSVDSNPIIYPGDIIEIEKAKPIYVIGEVMSPQGVYLKENGLTVREAIFRTGGISRDVKVKEVKVLRQKPNSKDYDEILVNWDLLSKNQGQDPVLEPYDVVIVNKPKKSVKQTILELVIGVGRTAVQTVGTGVPQRILY